MKLEYLSCGPPARPLVRLYAFTPGEAERLRAAIAGLASGHVQECAVHELPGVESIGGCRLTLRLAGWDQAMVSGDSAGEWGCGLTAGTWDNVAGLIEPFLQPTHGYQWLADAPGEAALLLSVDGDW